MSGKLKNAPVYFAIVQARFNPILALDSYAPQIQEWFRKNGFPDVKRSVLATLNINVGGSAEGVPAPAPVQQANPRYTFCNIDLTSGFILDQGALSYQVTEYGGHEDFFATFMAGLQAIHDAVELSYIERVGFRYLDAVLPKPDEDLNNYLNPAVLGLAGQLDGDVIHSFSETKLRTANSIDIVARAIIQNGEVGFPPDLSPSILKIAERFRTQTGHHAILDTDAGFENRFAYSSDHVNDYLVSIHDELAKAFHATITDNAINAWK